VTEPDPSICVDTDEYEVAMPLLAYTEGTNSSPANKKTILFFMVSIILVIRKK